MIIINKGTAKMDRITIEVENVEISIRSLN